MRTEVFLIKAGKIKNQDLIKIQNLVGDISDEDLRHVDCYVSDHLGIFIPSVGFCENAITPSHTHPSYLFVVYFTKEQSFINDNIELPDKHYLVSVIEPEIPHEEKPLETFKRYIAIFISKETFEGIYKEYSKEQLSQQLVWEQFVVGHEIMIYIKKFMFEFENKILGYKTILDALAKIIGHCLVRNFLNIDNKTDFVTEKFEFDSIIDFMHQHFGQKITIAELAKKINMSESHFIRVFKKETGVSPMDYLIRIRIEKAKKLLRIGTKNITEVSLFCGFGSTSHFSSSFTKHTGFSPSEYQNVYSVN